MSDSARPSALPPAAPHDARATAGADRANGARGTAATGTVHDGPHDGPLAGAATPGVPRVRRARARDIDEPHRVSTPLELLFDLTFVVAVSLAGGALHHGLAEHPGIGPVINYVYGFIAIWVAWMNYTWFASAFDNDDPPFRVLTMLQMVGAAVFATGVANLTTHGAATAVVGYAIMRVCLATQWLRVVVADPPLRRLSIRYAAGILGVQALWILRLFLPPSWAHPTFLLFMAFELLIPVWAETSVPGGSPWHAHHIAERHGLFTIILIGEVVTATVNAISSALGTSGWTPELALTGIAGMTLALLLWWMYFLLPSGQSLHQSRARSWRWGYGHIPLYLGIGLVGVGLECVADLLAHAPAAHAVAAQAHDAAAQIHDAAAQAHGAASQAHGAAAGHDGLSAVQAVSIVAVGVALFSMSLWGVWAGVTRARAQLLPLALTACASLLLGPVAVAFGAPAMLGVLLVCAGPLLLVVRTELGMRRRADSFMPRP